MGRTARLLLALALVAGCEDPLAAPADGMGCELGPDPCGEGEVCHEGFCVAKEDVEAPLPTEDDFRVTVQADGYTILPDGLDPMILRIRVAHENGDPFEGKLLVRADPFTAATFDPPVLEFENGLAATRIAGCAKQSLFCPPFFVVELALHDLPTVIIGRGEERFRVDGVPKDRFVPWGNGGEHMHPRGALTGRTGGAPAGGGGGGPDEIVGPAVPGLKRCKGPQWRTVVRISGQPAEEDAGRDVGRARGENTDSFGGGDATVTFPVSPVRDGGYSAGRGARLFFSGLAECRLNGANVKIVNGAVTIGGTGTCANRTTVAFCMNWIPD